MRSFHVHPAIVFFAILCLAGGLAGGDKKDEGQNPLKVAIEAVDVRAGVYVGTPLRLKVILHNTTDKPLLIQDWDKGPHVLILSVCTKDYPGQSGGSWGPIGFGRPRVAMPRLGPILRPLPSGETLVERSVTPMIPGRVRIAVQVWCPPRKFWQEKGVENVWNGRVYGETVVVVPTQMAPEMKERYAGLRKELEDAQVGAERKIKILAEMAADRHYFAAHFIRDAYETLEPGRVKEAALEHLVDLAQFGTAYESFPLLVEVMADEKTPQETRKTLIGWMGDVLARGGRQNLAGQAFHQYPEPLQQEVRQAIKLLARDRNPLIAAKAREVLKRLPDEKEK